MSSRRNAFVNYPRWNQPQQEPGQQATQPPTPLDLIPAVRPKKRGRQWEKRNRAWSYKIPRPLWDVAKQIRDDIYAIAQFREDGKPRGDSTTVDAVATALIDWALGFAEQDPSFLSPRTNPHPRGRLMTLAWEEWNGWPRELPTPSRRTRRADKEAKDKVFVLTYRWPEELVQRIKLLAGKGLGTTNNAQKYNPLKYSVPVGEVVVKLLQRAIDDYKNGRMRLQLHTVQQSISGWEQSGSEGVKRCKK